MTRQITMTVTVRPHAEAIELDGLRFTKPEELWAHLHGQASKEAGKPQSVRRSLFISSAVAEAWATALEGEASRVRYLAPRAKELAPGQCKRAAEELGL